MGQVGKPPLTRRERDVATLVAQGLTDRQIAERLSISQLTAKAHVDAIGHKLGYESRSQIAAWITEQYLHSTMSQVAGNLPLQLTSFIGRQEELSDLTELSSGARLLTMVGPAGVGKTRLALQLAVSLAPRYPAGTWWVDLGSISDSVLIPSAVAINLYVQEQFGRPLLETLIEHCSSRQMILLLDNCEHLIEGVAELSALFLRSCPHLFILTTSRETLRIEGETVWRAPSLTAADAIQLFAERAAAVQGAFELTAANEEVVAAICGHLDRLPLAIELTAARAGSLPLEDILPHLAGRFSLLASGARARPKRHETLRTALDWSYELLSEEQATLFARLSVFSGGFDARAVQEVCSFEGTNRGTDIMLLTELVEKSLVQLENRRYRCLETVQEYGRERLQEHGEYYGLQERHCAYFLAQAEQRAAGGLADWLARMEAERDNLRAALTWALQRDVATAVRLVLALNPWWQLRGHLNEVRPYLESLLLGYSKDDSARIGLLLDAGWAAYASGSAALALERIEAALSLARSVGDLPALIDGLILRGRYETNEGHPATAEPWLSEAAAISAEILDEKRSAEVLHVTGAAAGAQLDLARARSAFEASLQIRRSLNRADEALQTLQYLAGIVGAETAYDQSRSLIAEALHLGRRLGDRTMHQALDVAAGLAIVEGDPVRGLRLAAASDAALEANGLSPVPVWERLLQPYLDAARAAVDADVALRARNEGMRMPYWQAVEDAITSLAVR
jgi:predicted ATPase/DNA-binding CsgD family transcriptional regulator